MIISICMSPLYWVFLFTNLFKGILDKFSLPSLSIWKTGESVHFPEVYIVKCSKVVLYINKKITLYSEQALHFIYINIQIPEERNICTK